MKELMKEIIITADPECTEKSDANWRVAREWMLKDENMQSLITRLKSKRKADVLLTVLDTTYGVSFKLGFVAGWNERELKYLREKDADRREAGEDVQ